jgi:DUF971 family protein
MNTPTGIEADRAAGTLSITWEDGHHSLYSLADLRWACPCAVCSGEWGRPGVLHAMDRLPDDELQLADMQLVGSYAVMPIWQSGHDSGIYAFDYLRSLCPCPQCRRTPQPD